MHSEKPPLGVVHMHTSASSKAALGFPICKDEVEVVSALGSFTHKTLAIMLLMKLHFDPDTKKKLKSTVTMSCSFTSVKKIPGVPSLWLRRSELSG